MMLGYLKIAATLAVVTGLIYAGWTANNWRVEALRARALNAQLIEQQVRLAAANRAREAVSIKLAESESNEHIQIRQIIKRVPVYVDRGTCSLSIDGLRELNKARILPPAPN
jgi:hypothetical protein